MTTETATDRWTKDERAALALRVREHIVRMATGGGCFIGASLSCADLLVHLYTRVLRVSPERLRDPNRDTLLLSKGHDVPALYGVLAELGYFPKERLANHLKTSDSIYWHPNRSVPGIEFHSGSLGHCLSVGVGVALEAKMRGSDGTSAAEPRRGPHQTPRTFVVLGDGECDEGSVWEALLVASAKKLDNLVAIVDRNEIQANMRTEELVPLEPLGAKFRAFGAAVARIDGHDFGALDEAFARFPMEEGKPSVVICDTVRGKGLPSIENRVNRLRAHTIKRKVKVLLEGDLFIMHLTSPGPHYVRKVINQDSIFIPEINKTVHTGITIGKSQICLLRSYMRGDRMMGKKISSILARMKIPCALRPFWPVLETHKEIIAVAAYEKTPALHQMVLEEHHGK